MRPSFAPFALSATAILAINNLLIALKMWPTVRLAIPLMALGLLAVAINLVVARGLSRLVAISLEEAPDRLRAPGERV